MENMKNKLLIILLLLILPYSVLSSTVLDSLKRARAENFNRSLIENSVRKAMASSESKLNGVVYLEIDSDTFNVINKCEIIKSLTTVEDNVFLSAIPEEINGKKLSIYISKKEIEDDIKRKIIYRIQIDWGSLKSVELYEGRKKIDVDKFIEKLNRNISDIYTASLEKCSYEGVLNFELSIDEKGIVLESKTDSALSSEKSKYLSNEINKFFKSIKFPSLDGATEIFKYEICFKFEKSWFPDAAGDTLVIPIEMTQEREDSIVNYIKDEYDKDYGSIPLLNSSVFVLSTIDGIDSNYYNSYIHSHFFKEFDRRYSYIKSDDAKKDKDLIDWHRNFPDKGFNKEWIRYLKNSQYLLIISFQYMAYPANVTSFSGMGVAFNFIPGFVGSGGNFTGGSFNVHPTSINFQQGYGTAVIAGLKFTFYNISTGKRICIKGDYNDSSFKANDSSFRKEVLYNIDEILEDITFY